MPGVVNMDSGGVNGARTDHDRRQAANGVNGISGEGAAKGAASGKPGTLAGTKAGEANATANGDVVSSAVVPHEPGGQTQSQQGARMNNLPDDITHITQGFVSLSLLFSRLAQHSHNALQAKLVALAAMPLPGPVLNGNSSHGASAPDDSSSGNLNKKAALLHFAQDMHAKWVKALVIAEWSRKSDMVSKLIDIKFHLDQQRILFDVALDNLVNVKRDLTYARMPPPDLKTALQILATGTAPWLPDLYYIDPPPLTTAEQTKWTNDLNTLLSLRLNLEDFDKIPPAFREYEIRSGRVTFKVPGEFEVDLTIADEDFEKQFWFIDFRLTFSPAAVALPEKLRAYMEGCVNDALEKNGLTGCYQFLHDFTLTAKINEIKRQALRLSKTSWTGTLMVEPLNRALAIQYWTTRSQPPAPKNWVLLAVNSRPKGAELSTARGSSYLVAKWYRGNKEVKEVDVPFDLDSLSAENLMKSVVGLHVEHILTSIYDKLCESPRFKNREAGLALHISRTNPADSHLEMQVGYKGKLSLLIEPTTGFFAVKPQSRFAIQYEQLLNHGKNPAEDGVKCLESIRCGLAEDQLTRSGMCAGWLVQKAPVTPEALRSALRSREWTKIIWLQKEGWSSTWYIAVLLGLAGDEWWVIETNSSEGGRSLKTNARLPLNRGHPDPSDSFWGNLTTFATGVISQITDLRELHRQRIKGKQIPHVMATLPQNIRLPQICFALSSIIPAVKQAPDGPASGMNGSDGADDQSVFKKELARNVSRKRPWAHDRILVHFRGIEAVPRHDASGMDGTDETGEPKLRCISDAFITVQNPAKFTTLNGQVDKDVSYNAKTGEFRVRIRHLVGQPVLEMVRLRVKAIDRFVNLLESLDRARGMATSEDMSLSRVSFTYGNEKAGPGKWRVVLDLSKDDIDIVFEKGNPHLRVVDLSKKLVNTEGGIGLLMAWLPLSLPFAAAVDRIESSWEPLNAGGKGELAFSFKSMDWLSMQYVLAGGGIGKTEQRLRRKVLTLELRLRLRRGNAWWHVWRVSPTATRPLPTDDLFAQALRPIWNGKGKGWQGLASGATAKPAEGVVELMHAVDAAIQALARGEMPPQGEARESALVID